MKFVYYLCGAVLAVSLGAIVWKSRSGGLSTGLSDVANPSETATSLDKTPATPLKAIVTSVAVATSFQVYVGGGTNISPPEPFHSSFSNGGSMPAIAISSSGGSSFLAGNLTSSDSKTKLIKVECAIENPTETTEFFRIGDLSLFVSGHHVSDFMAVGYGDRLCAIADVDRRIVKQTVIELLPKTKRTFSYIFTLCTPEAKQGEIRLQHSPINSVHFQINDIGLK